MARKRFELIVSGKDVNDVVRFARGRVMVSRCPSLALAALLLEASELAILFCKDEWPFLQDKDSSLDDIRSEARICALNVYHNGGGNSGDCEL